VVEALELMNSLWPLPEDPEPSFTVFEKYDQSSEAMEAMYSNLSQPMSEAIAGVSSSSDYLILYLFIYLLKFATNSEHTDQFSIKSAAA
jgi:hypothetical protein